MHHDLMVPPLTPYSKSEKEGAINADFILYDLFTSLKKCIGNKERCSA